MQPTKEAFELYGLSAIMSDELRKEIERQLLVDLILYGVNIENLKFDWSESVIEGRSGNYLNSSFDRYSGIRLFSQTGEIVADGWMDFILEKEENIFIVFWWYLTIYQNGIAESVKDHRGIPNHIFEILPDKLRDKYKEI